MAKKRITQKIIKIVKGYTQRLQDEEGLPIERVVVFGSQVKGKSQRYSDIDVCIVSSEFKDTFKALQFLWQRRNDEEVRMGLEPIGFSKEDFEKGNSLIQEIKKTGIEILRK